MKELVAAESTTAGGEGHRVDAVISKKPGVHHIRLYSLNQRLAPSQACLLRRTSLDLASESWALRGLRPGKTNTSPQSCLTEESQNWVSEFVSTQLRMSLLLLAH